MVPAQINRGRGIRCGRRTGPKRSPSASSTACAAPTKRGGTNSAPAGFGLSLPVGRDHRVTAAGAGATRSSTAGSRCAASPMSTCRSSARPPNVSAIQACRNDLEVSALSDYIRTVDFIPNSPKSDVPHSSGNSARRCRWNARCAHYAPELWAPAGIDNALATARFRTQRIHFP
jgi:hypothetical protein